MAISSLGVGSGIDLNGMLTSLMQVETQPLVAMQTKETSYQARISAYGTLKSTLSSLQTAAKAFIPSAGQTVTDKFSTLKANIGDTTIATASASTGAIPASYTLSNITLAKAEQIRKDQASITIPATSGTLSIKVGSAAAVSVNVAGGASLSDIATAINGASAGVTAAIINTGSTSYLVVSANNSGQSNQITITGDDATHTGAWDSFNYVPRGSSTVTGYTNNLWTEQQAAKSASVDVNGLNVTSDSNTISTAISGVSLTLTKESVTGTTLSVSKDTSSTLSSALVSFVKAYNDSATSMKSLGNYDIATKKAGALQGNTSLRSAQSQVRNMLFTKAGGSSNYQTLSDLGISAEKDGTLKLDTTKMNAAVAADFSGVATLVSTLGTTFKDGLEGIIGTTGNLTSATASTNRMIAEIQKRQTVLVDRLNDVRARYIKQFSALDSLVASMNTTSTYLTQQLANLPGASSS